MEKIKFNNGYIRHISDKYSNLELFDADEKTVYKATIPNEMIEKLCAKYQNIECDDK